MTCENNCDGCSCESDLDQTEKYMDGIMRVFTGVKDGEDGAGFIADPDAAMDALVMVMGHMVAGISENTAEAHNTLLAIFSNINEAYKHAIATGQNRAFTKVPQAGKCH